MGYKLQFVPKGCLWYRSGCIPAWRETGGRKSTVFPFCFFTGLCYFPVCTSFARALPFQEKNEAGNFASLLPKEGAYRRMREEKSSLTRSLS